MRKELIVLCFLYWNARKDYKTRMISILSMVICGGVFLIMHAKNLQMAVNEIPGWIPGGILGIFSIITGGQLGFGDALITGMVGWILGWREIVWVLLWAWIIMAVYAGRLVIKRERKRIPFIPFLLVGYVVELICNTGVQ